MTTGTTLNHKITTISDVESFESTPLSERSIPADTYHAIKQVAQKQPNALAIRYIENGETWRQLKDKGEVNISRDITYAELLEKITQSANLFRSLGGSDTDVVSMVLPNVPEAHYVIWGGEAAGIVNPINYMLDGEEIGEIANSAGSKILVIMGQHSDVDIFDKLDHILSTAPLIEHVLVVGEFPVETKNVVSFEEAINQHSATALEFDRELTEDTIASLFHTGGTTGVPKLAQHTHFNETYTAWAMNISIQSSPNDCNLTGLPLFHCNAAISNGLLSFMSGASILLSGVNGYRTPGIVQNLFHIFDHYRVTIFTAVPTIYAVLVQLPIEGLDLSSVRCAASGAAPMPVELFNNFAKKTGITVGEGYGLTESTVCVTLTSPFLETPRIGSVGIRLPYMQVKAAILDGDGKYIRDCNVNEIGVLILRGPSVSPGYTDSKKNADLFLTDIDGNVWLNSGDLARQDEDGFFWLTGRAKELIIRGGHNIDPKTIEEVLAAHPAVNLAAAVGRPDSYAGEIPVAYIDTVSDVTEEELITYCQQNIKERAAVPKAIIFLDKLPVTGIGKTHKPTLHLMEIEFIVERAIKSLGNSIAEFTVSAEADPKKGNIAIVSVTALAGEDTQKLDNALRKLLGAYSFGYELKIS